MAAVPGPGKSVQSRRDVRFGVPVDIGGGAGAGLRRTVHRLPAVSGAGRPGICLHDGRGGRSQDFISAHQDPGVIMRR